MDTAGASENNPLDRIVLRMVPLDRFSSRARRTAFTRKKTDSASTAAITMPDNQNRNGSLTENGIFSHLPG